MLIKDLCSESASSKIGPETLVTECELGWQMRYQFKFLNDSLVLGSSCGTLHTHNVHAWRQTLTNHRTYPMVSGDLGKQMYMHIYTTVPPCVMQWKVFRRSKFQSALLDSGWAGLPCLLWLWANACADLQSPQDSIAYKMVWLHNISMLSKDDSQQSWPTRVCCRRCQAMLHQRKRLASWRQPTWHERRCKHHSATLQVCLCPSCGGRPQTDSLRDTMELCWALTRPDTRHMAASLSACPCCRRRCKAARKGKNRLHLPASIWWDAKKNTGLPQCKAATGTARNGWGCWYR